MPRPRRARPLSTPLQVFAAGSLRPAFDALAGHWRSHRGLPVDVRYDNARELADAIQAGARADVFASASARDPGRLTELGIARPGRAFATNHLVVAVPTASAIDGANALADSNTRVVIEVAGIPLGDYTRELLQRLNDLYGGDFAQRVLANVVAQRHTVDDVTACLHSGQADAAIVYATDVAAAAGRLRAIQPPPQAATTATYVLCALRAAPQPTGARDWIDLTLGPTGAQILRTAGFDPPP